jgi:lipopolysaccharide biosynthesis protein
VNENALLRQLQASSAPGPFHAQDVAGSPAPADPKVRLIAFYLPQFHPIPENDAWWGAGFTEWTNVTRGVPRFVGHVQPRLPGDLGFYDLRNPAVLHRQARLARRYGIHGFAFHHYWFNGRRLLEKPLELLLGDPSLDLPFCICWANENWTRRWDGHDNEVLLGQRYSADDDVDFARSLVPILRDRRYIRIDGRPLIIVYRPGLLPEPAATMRRWRVALMRAGLANPYIVMVQGFDDLDPRQHGVDAAAEFPPHKLGATQEINGTLQILDPDYVGEVRDYADVARFALAQERPPYRMFRGVFPCWDNEARRPGQGLTFAHSTPDKYADWLSGACRLAIAEASHPDERIVFINAWNEWGEGAYLEPDRHFGHAYLAATARALRGLDDRGTGSNG